MLGTCAICQCEIADDDARSILAKLDGKDVWICGRCYPDRIAERFPDHHQAQIHCEAGRGYLATGQPNEEQAEECFLRGLALCRTADLLVGMGNVARTREEADQWYREAIALDPFHLAARMNLAHPTAEEAPQVLARITAEIKSEGGDLPRNCAFCGSKKVEKEYNRHPLCRTCWSHRKKLFNAE